MSLINCCVVSADNSISPALFSSQCGQEQSLCHLLFVAWLKIIEPIKQLGNLFLMATEELLSILKLGFWGLTFPDAKGKLKMRSAHCKALWWVFGSVGFIHFSIHRILNACFNWSETSVLKWCTQTCSRLCSLQEVAGWDVGLWLLVPTLPRGAGVVPRDVHSFVWSTSAGLWGSVRGCSEVQLSLQHRAALLPDLGSLRSGGSRSQLPLLPALKNTGALWCQFVPPQQIFCLQTVTARALFLRDVNEPPSICCVATGVGTPGHATGDVPAALSPAVWGREAVSVTTCMQRSV